MTKKQIASFSNGDLITQYILARDIATEKYNFSRRGAKTYNDAEKQLLNELFARGLISEQNKHDLLL